MEMLLVSAASAKLWEVEEAAEGKKGRRGPAGSAGLSHGSGGGQTSGRARRWGDAGRTLDGGKRIRFSAHWPGVLQMIS